MRTFTGDPLERVLIEATQSAAPAIDRAIAELLDAADRDVIDPRFATDCRLAEVHLTEMVSAIDAVRRADGMSAFFAQVLRPFYQELSVAGTRYPGPGASQLPTYLLDQILWASDCDDPTLRRFHEYGARFGPPAYREAFTRRAVCPSLGTRVAAALERPAAAPSAEQRGGAHALMCLLRVLIRFRGKHSVVLRRTYAEQVRTFGRGSGGGDLELVQHILGLTRAHAMPFADRAPSGASPARHLHRRRREP